MLILDTLSIVTKTIKNEPKIRVNMLHLQIGVKQYACFPSSEHLQDSTTEKGSIRCLECDQEFDVPSNRFPPHKMAANILTKELRLSDEEKKLKHVIQELTQQLEQLLPDFKQKHTELKRINFDHLTEVRRQIDLQREEI